MGRGLRGRHDLSLPSTRPLSSGGILAYSPDVLPELPFVDWADSKAVSTYCAELPAVRLLASRLRLRYESGSIFGQDYAWLISQVYSEWFGLFGFSSGQMCPGMRVPLPKAVSERAYSDEEFFRTVSEGYFQSFGSLFFGDRSAFDAQAPWTPHGTLRPAFWFFRNAKFSEFSQGSKIFLRVSFGVDTRFYHFDSSRRMWAFCKEPAGASWGKIINSNFWFFFFPYEGRFLWGPAADGFFARFSFPVINKGEFNI